MDSITLTLLIFAVALVGVTLHAWRLGNERRDVALLGSFAGMAGLGAVVAAAI
jgi:hypothetical protein